ncbi:MAG: right-handed parallel beta-helix repeat-containing protein [Kineosporiaceae bacterium]|nr:right-handed parallel beta-helix repeat-containing protein [Aeromicrobium sp.]
MGAAALASLGVVLAMIAPSAASAVDASAISIAGRSLDASAVSPGTHVVQVVPPAGVSAVKFVLDGNYLGEATTSPYRWRVSVAGGAHKFSAHWSGPDAQRVTAVFTVAGPKGISGSELVAPGSHYKKMKPSVSPVHPPPVSSTPNVLTGVTTPSVLTVSTASELSVALSNARPGDTITLADGVYKGKFTAAASGTAQAPITITGSHAAVLTSGGISGGYGLHVTGSYWVISGLSVARSGKGIVLDGSQHTRISGVDVGTIGEEGVHFRHNSADSSIEGSTVHDTGVRSPGFGEGIYIGSAQSNWATIMGSPTIPDRTDRVTVSGNHLINTAAEGVDVKEGTTGGSLRFNIFTNAGYSGVNYADSWVDVKGNGYLIEGNGGSMARADAFQVHQASAGWGLNNRFLNNGAVAGVPGYLVNVAVSNSGTTVQCQSTAAGRGLSNIRCVS